MGVLPTLIILLVLITTSTTFTSSSSSSTRQLVGEENCDIISGNKGQFVERCECGTCCDRKTWRGDWDTPCGFMCRNPDCKDYDWDALMFTIFVSLLYAPVWFALIKIILISIQSNKIVPFIYPLALSCASEPFIVVLAGGTRWCAIVLCPIILTYPKINKWATENMGERQVGEVVEVRDLEIAQVAPESAVRVGDGDSVGGGEDVLVTTATMVEEAGEGEK